MQYLIVNLMNTKCLRAYRDPCTMHMSSMYEDRCIMYTVHETIMRGIHYRQNNILPLIKASEFHHAQSIFI